MSLYITKKNFINYLLILLIAATILSVIVTPIIVDNKDNNWDSEVEKSVYSIQSEVIDLFKARISEIVKNKDLLKDKLRNELKKISASESLASSILGDNSYKNYSIQVSDGQGRLVLWNSTTGFSNSLDTSSFYGEAYFKNFELFTFLSIDDTININDTAYLLSINLALEKNYYLENEYFIPLSLTETLSSRFNTRFEIGYDKYAQKSRDGRLHSLDILNNFSNKIGVVNFQKPSRDFEINVIRANLNTVTYLLVIFLIISLSVKYLYLFRKIPRRITRFAVYCFAIIGLRIILFIFNLPSQLLDNDLLNASYFSSVFAYGIVRSPLEFFITALVFLSICIYAFKLTRSYIQTSDKKNGIAKWVLPLVVLGSVFVYLMLLRGFGASVKSVIFDSTLRYFKDPSLLPDPPAFLMHLNILILGFCSVMMGVIILVLIINLLIPIFRRHNTLFGILFLTFLQGAGYLFDYLQKNPQGTVLSRVLFITLTCVIAFLMLKHRKVFLQTILVSTFVASFMTILLLSFYNSELERESLKLTALELVRPNENYLDYSVFQTLSEALNTETIRNTFIDSSVNPDQSAFKIWSRSVLQKEAIRSRITIHDANYKQIGVFNFQFPDGVGLSSKVNQADNNGIQITRRDLSDNNGKVISGFTKIFNENTLLGYVEVSVLYNPNELISGDVPPFLSTSLASFNSTVDLTKLNIFDFHNGVLTNSISDFYLSNDEINFLLDGNTFSQNEKWLKIQINNEPNIIYVLRSEQDGLNRIIVVLLKERDISWNLFDFFKVFFIQTIFVMFFLIVYWIYLYSRAGSVHFSFRAQLLLAFLFLSIIPSILLAVYFKDLTEEKNDSAIFYKLSKRVKRVEEYFKFHEAKDIFTNKNNLHALQYDLDVKFTLYDNNTQFYSSDKMFSETGLFESYIDADAYLKLTGRGMKECVEKRKIENFEYNSYYSFINIGDKKYIIEVNDLFNSILLPLSDIELDIALFGTYSLAAILVAIFSTLLANQISRPIRKLTGATKSVASGDLSIEVNGSWKGEIKELTDGFNIMVKDLKKNQSQIAEMERESAWKEMAKQVAHEIKNPLTPMKLSVQQLVIAHKDKSPKFDTIFEKVTNTIINQIDILKNIAQEFSSFARMPSIKLTEVYPQKIINEVCDLFSEEKIDIEFKSLSNAIKINADIDQLKRTLVNLIRNSMQAEARRIDITLEQTENNCRIKVRDDGRGIAEDKLAQIFDKEFTTKKEGMGLGLSMAKRYLANLNGDIYVESSSSAGTSIILKIPIVSS